MRKPKFIAAASVAGVLLGITAPTWTQTTGGDADVAKLAAQVTALSARVAQLETRLKGPLTVKQPFTVQDDSGAVIMEVSKATLVSVKMGKAFRYEEDAGSSTIGLVPEGGSWVEFGADRQSAFVTAHKGGGSVRFATGDAGPRLDVRSGGVIANLGVSDTSSNMALRFLAGTSQVAAMGMDANGGGVVQVLDGKGSTLAGLSTNAAGGQVAVFAKGGKPAAALAMREGAGIVQIHDSKGEVLGSLYQAQNGGMLQLNSLAGEPMVEAGVLSSQKGIVRTGPWMRVGNMMGIPGSFITGK